MLLIRYDTLARNLTTLMTPTGLMMIHTWNMKIKRNSRIGPYHSR
ncbi:hypothetical protein [Acidiplasma aeolicum]|nr:hypothetical protein [Acidiplasma aeolicum]